MKSYDPKKIEGKWQKEWDKKGIYKAKEGKGKKFYSLIEFPYPSGAGLHVGHIRSNTAMDVISRKRRVEGYNVLYPIGWDAFGLPTENYAIKTGIQPAKVTKQNTDNFRKQLKALGFSFDWSREVNTTDPKYYKWTQWIFLQMWKKGLAYKEKSEINWCPKDKIGLANEEVVGGLCERCGTPVEKREKEQWMLAITKYADRLDKDLDGVDYLEKIKIQQRNWIGKSEGMLFTAPVKDTNLKIQTFNAHFEAFAADTFVVIAPDHPFLKELIKGTESEEEVLDFSKMLVSKRNKQGFEEDKNVEGIFTGRYIVDPVSNGDLPIWVASYAVADYGTGIVKCSAHDDRDFAFAKKYNIPLKEVLIPKVVDTHDPPRADKKTVARRAVQAIVIDPSTKKVLVLKWKKFPWTTFVTGGVEGGEDIVEAAKREILEETGYKNVKYIRTLGSPVESHFFANHKNENRKATFSAIHFELENDVREKISSEEDAIHEVCWMTWDELKADKNIKCAEYDIWVDRFFNAPHAWTDMKNAVMLEPKEFAGRVAGEARGDIIKYLEDNGLAKKQITYKLRDWVFSRQRYWGEPIPLIYCVKCAKWHPVPEKDLPLELPKVKKYEPTDDGESPLSAITKWVNVKCPVCKSPAKRETDTMPQWAGSSWYYLRYMDPKNNKEFASKKNIKYWNPVDWYNGGMEHTTLHLLYSRFWHKFLYDLKLVLTNEPYKKRTSHGLILAGDGDKMSKSKGNVVNPDELVKIWGADSLRVYEMFMGPFDQAIPWSTDNIIGVRRFLERVWKLQFKVNKKVKVDKKIDSLLHQTIKKVGEDIEDMKFNTAVSSMMILVNELEKAEQISKQNFEMLLQLLAPFAPHITEELWRVLGNKKSIHISAWPKFDAKKVLKAEVNIAVQVNGKVRTVLTVESDANEATVKDMALGSAEVKKWLEGKEVKKVIFVPNKILNIVVA